ncbi:MAG: TIM barrel protein [Phycisphaerae bacterium]|jgi:hypothetical protein|nr:TIM barrel protein [Phycisphaerae bacterium]
MIDRTHTSRRQFIAGTLAAAGACTLGLAAEKTPAIKKPSPKIRLGLATYTWGKDWDIAALIKNLPKAGIYGVELRTSFGWAHGVETTLTTKQRAEVKKRFADSPVKLVALACSERMDWPDPKRLKRAIESAKAHIKLSHDVGSSSLRIFPNTFHKNVPREKTIAQIARAGDEVGVYAAKLGQQVDLEAHGPAGALPTMAAIMKCVKQPNVRVRLNSDSRDVKGKGFDANFKMVANHLASTIHIHNLKSDFPYQRQCELLVAAGWSGWVLMENSNKVPDRIEAMIEQRKIWEKLMVNAAKTRR